MSARTSARLTAAQLDRACGAVLGSAAGDALGAAYEFGCATVGPHGPQMLGGGLGNFAPGEWTDDTSMAWAVLDAAATPGADLRTDAALDRIAHNFRAWFDTRPPDIGNQTRRVLADAGPQPTGATMTATAYDLHARTGHTGGNGSLMRTAPVALPHLDDATAVAEAARRVSALTHADPRAQEACVLWSLAIRHAILFGEFEIRAGLAHLDDEAATYWAERIDDAETLPPSTFSPNGWVVTAFQAAWAAIVQTPIPGAGAGGMPCAHLPAALATAIGIGHDTDTVAAIAGALLGARWGASAIPAHWRRPLHGYPGRTGDDLVELAHLAAYGGPLSNGWPTVDRIDYHRFHDTTHVLVRHPADPGVWLGDSRALDPLPDEVTAVVSLCLLGRDQGPKSLPHKSIEHITYRLIDVPDPADNPNLVFLLADAAATVHALRTEGHVVLVHCVAAQSRTPAVAIAYGLQLGQSLTEATDQVLAALPDAHPNSAFTAALARLATGHTPSNDEERP